MLLYNLTYLMTLYIKRTVRLKMRLVIITDTITMRLFVHRMSYIHIMCLLYLIHLIEQSFTNKINNVKPMQKLLLGFAIIVRFLYEYFKMIINFRLISLL